MFGSSHAAFSAIMVVVASGCAIESAAKEGEADQALSGDFVDGSGTITVRIKQCPASPTAQHPTTTCSVDSDFVLIGGGAEVIGEGDPGAMLVASYPDSSLSTWIAASKDHLSGASFPHQLGAYSVGLRLNGVSPDTLRRSMVLVSAHSNPAHHPATSVSVPVGFNLIGGGARANYSADGQLLTSSFPDSFQWVAGSKDHLSSDVGTVDAFAIGLTTGVIPGFGSSIDVFANRTFTFVSTGYGTAALNTPSGWVLASIGGDAQYNGNGRMLTDMIPFVDAPSNSLEGAVIRSKDHESHDNGNTFAYLTSIRRH